MAVKKKFPYKAAIVSCNGGCRAVKGEAGCSEGCIGCGACVDACKFGAISLNEYGVAEVDESKCIACKKCWENNKCVFVDSVNEFLDIAGDYDGFVFGTPVHWGGASGAITLFMDRAFYADLNGGGDRVRLKPAGGGVSSQSR